MQGFSEWATRHCTIFGLFDAKHAAMVASWQAVFDACGFAAAEMGEATGFLAAHRPPEFPSQHLGALLGRVRSARAERHRAGAGAEPEDDRGRCVLCAGAGLVTVPDPRSVRGGEWVGLPLSSRDGVHFAESVVTCSCYRGRTLNCAGRNGEPRVTLERYERAIPYWKAMLEQREHEERAQRAAEARAGGGDLRDPLDRLLARLAARQRQPGEDREEEAA